MKSILRAFCFGATAIVWAAFSEAAPIYSIYSIEDSDIRNDTGGGGGNPNGVNNRADFLEVRNLVQLPSTVRKRISYVKFDISAIDPRNYASATISFSFADNRNAAGVMSVYGLIDGAANPDSSFNEANWFSLRDAMGQPFTNNGTVVPTPPADGLSWSKGLGVDPTIMSGDTSGNLGINPSEATLLGVINIPGAVNDILSNRVDLPLGNFLAADTNGVVTFMLADNRNGSPSAEWRIRAREHATLGNLSTRLNYVPEPGSLILLAFAGLLGSSRRTRHRRSSSLVH